MTTDEPRADAWVITVGERLIRVAGASAESVRSMIKEALLELIDNARIDVRPMTDAEREDFESDGPSQDGIRPV